MVQAVFNFFFLLFSFQLTPETKRPVLVFIHGGGFIMGENHREFYGPDYFIKKDVVLVTIQYRLGVFGMYHIIPLILH